MKGSVLTLYEKTAEEFADRVRRAFGDAVHSIVLYGSVAKKTAGSHSDIDILVLTEDGEALLDRLVDISESLDFENNYDTFLVVTSFTPERLMELSVGRFPIADHVLREGIVLYDDGTFERIRENALAVG
ncbi:MAG: nucleotidyltransferase domain-containing protein [Chloroflexota bacterium]|nr:nucleotidyltransferase domain-containing protein [Chloroflexota bacterium]